MIGPLHATSYSIDSVGGRAHNRLNGLLKEPVSHYLYLSNENLKSARL